MHHQSSCTKMDEWGRPLPGGSRGAGEGGPVSLREKEGLTEATEINSGGDSGGRDSLTIISAGNTDRGGVRGGEGCAVTSRWHASTTLSGIEHREGMRAPE